MKDSRHWYNIRTYLAKGDFDTARVWLSNAHRDLHSSAMNQLVQTIHEWMLQTKYDERILELLSKFDQSGDAMRRSQANDPIYISLVIQRVRKLPLTKSILALGHPDLTI